MANLVSSGKGLVSTDYLSWAPSESGTFSDPEVAFGAVGPEPGLVATSIGNDRDMVQTKQSLGDLVANHVTALRRSYVERGWQVFRTGDYQAALRLFNLAENASIDSPQDRATIKLAMVYVAIAAGQHAQASYCLEWLVWDNSRNGQSGHPDAFNRLFDENAIATIGELYVDPEGGAHQAEYQAHNQLIESFAAQNPDALQAQALYAIIDWGRGRRENAIFTARKITDPASKFSRLASVLEAANRMRGLEMQGAAFSGLNSVSAEAAAAQTQPSR